MKKLAVLLAVVLALAMPSAAAGHGTPSSC
jgi:hypothetical protein